MLVPVLALGLLMQQPTDDSYKGSSLFRSCKAAVRIAGGEAKESDYSEFRNCTAYIDGFTDGVNLLGTKVCVGTATLGTMARVYVAYMESHPKMMDEPKNFGLIVALEDAYPCPKK